MKKGLFDLRSTTKSAREQGQSRDDSPTWAPLRPCTSTRSARPKRRQGDRRARLDGAIGDNEQVPAIQTAKGIRDAPQRRSGGAWPAGVASVRAWEGASWPSRWHREGTGCQQAGAPPDCSARRGRRPEIMTLPGGAVHARHRGRILAIIQSGELKAKKIGTATGISKKR